MKKIAIMMALAVAFGGTFCKKGASGEEVLETKYMKYRVGVFKDTDLKKYHATAEQGESVALLEESEISDAKGNKTKVAKIKLSDDSIAYTKADYLVKKIFAVIQGDVKVYNRNNETSGVKGKAAVGAIAAVSDEKAGWYLVELTLDNDKYAKGWIKEGFSDSPENVNDAIAYQRAVKGLADPKTKADSEKALTEISEKGGFLSAQAKAKLGIVSPESGDSGSTPGEWSETPAEKTSESAN